MPDGHGTLQRILDLLDAAGVEYQHLHHEPTPTSEDSARVRGEPLAIGGKALLVKADDAFHLVVISAARRVCSPALRRALRARKVRFATREELMMLTGLVPGSVPPLGEPVLPLPLHVDRSVLAHDRIAFNAGSLTDSIVMATSDYQRLAAVTHPVDISE